MTEIRVRNLRWLLEYDPVTGIFVRLTGRYRGKQVGYINPRGRLMIGLGRQKYFAHRLAWLYVHGKWPDGELDHINGDASDNRIVNLRPATRSQQNANCPARRTNALGIKGVSLDRGRYRAT